MDKLLGEIRVGLLECKVCLEEFSGQQRRALTLPCGHVLCASCLPSLSRPPRSQLDCPFCRRPCGAAQVSECLPIGHLAELLRASEAPPPAQATPVTYMRLQSSMGGWGVLANPTGTAPFGQLGALAVAHGGRHRVSLFTPQGQLLHRFGRREQICHPLGVAVSPDGHVVVTDAGDAAVKVFTPGGGRCVTEIRGGFRLPWGVTVDTRGHLLVTDALAGTLSLLVVEDISSGLTVVKVVLTDLCGPRAVASCPQTGMVAVVEHLAHTEGSTGHVGQSGHVEHPDGRVDHLGNSEGLAGHLEGSAGHSMRRGNKRKGLPSTRVKLFSPDFTLLCQLDNFSLSLSSSVQLSISAMTFDPWGHLLVADSTQAVVWSLGKFPDVPVLTPLVSEDLVYPVGLVASSKDRLVVLDAGDHALKVFTRHAATGAPTTAQETAG